MDTGEKFTRKAAALAALAAFLGCIPMSLSPTVYAADAPTIDRDLDGVADAQDNCPKIPNRRAADGTQPLVCGAGLRDALDRFVFIQSRTFRPTVGVDPAIAPSAGRVHGFIHIARDDDGIVLTAAQRVQLGRAGVRLGEYLPHYTYYASVPGQRAELERVVALPFVRGISAIQPLDRIARSVRLARGGASERHSDGTIAYSIDFHADVGAPAIKSLLASLGLRATLEDGTERVVPVPDYADVLALADSDLVLSIDHAPAEMVNRDDLSLSATRADLVDRVHGFEGSGLTVAMMEGRLLPLPPDQHPDMTLRVIADSTGTPQFTGHNLEVAGIMIGDGATNPANRGFLPDAILINYATNAFPANSLHRRVGFPRQAREHADAVVFNYSNGPRSNCNRLNAYRKEGRHHDRAVYETGISVVLAAGNTRGPGGTLAIEADDPDPERQEQYVRHGPCQRDNLDSLPHPVPKNVIMVGSWDLGLDALASTSAVGPAEDGRLKPDIVAPGVDLMTTTFDEDDSTFGYRSFSGTSAAAPVVSGIVGQVMDAFQNATVARVPTEVPPATVKAILLHTARDLGPFGPDYFNGFGMADAAAAVRTALRHDEFVYEGSVGESNSTDTYEFDVVGTQYGLKVTLAWDDVPASRSATETLINDLDLVVTEPSGAQSYYPLDTLLTGSNAVDRLAEANAGARVCEGLSCRDRVNNVEQVLIVGEDGTPLATGTWTATVSFNTIESGDQVFSLVATPGECPLRVYTDTVLGGPVTCPDEPTIPLDALEPAAVIIEYDDVSLDCGGHTITGAGRNESEYAGTHVGITSSRDGIRVTNCDVMSFDTGIQLVGSDDAVLSGNTVTDTDNGIELDASGSDGVEDTVVIGNTIIDARRSGIRALGALRDSTITTNVMNNVGADVAGIRLVAAFSGVPQGNAVAFNVLDNASVGISLEGFSYDDDDLGTVDGRPRANQVFGNVVNVETDVGVNEVLGDVNEIFANFIFTRQVGVQSTSSRGNVLDRNITTNLINGPAIGVTVSGAAKGSVSNNTITDVDTGVQLNLVQGEVPCVAPCEVRVDKVNTIRLRGSGVGVNVFGSNSVVVEDNSISSAAYDPASPADQFGTGILVNSCSNVILDGNVIDHVQSGVLVTGSVTTEIMNSSISSVDTGISVVSTPGTPITGNSVSGATVKGIFVQADSAAVTYNTIEYGDPGFAPVPVPLAAIHYASGNDGRIVDNTLSTTAPTASAIEVGVLSLFGGGGEVHGMVIEGQAAAGYDNGVTLRRNVRSVSIVSSSFDATNVALRGPLLPRIDEITVSCTELVGGSLDADFQAPVTLSGNTWSEITDGTLDIIDSDGDNLGDSGADHAFSSTDYSGPLASAALTSTRTSQVADDAPWMGDPALCSAP